MLSSLTLGTPHYSLFNPFNGLASLKIGVTNQGDGRLTLNRS